jgi:hypothetical protein
MLVPATFRMHHFMGDKGKVFDLIVQRSVVTGQVELDLDLDLDLNSNNNTSILSFLMLVPLGSAS